MTVFTGTVRRQRRLDEFTSTRGEVLGATLSEALEFNPAASIFRSDKLDRAMRGDPLPDVGVSELGFEPQRAPPDSPIIDAETARKRISESGLDISVPDSGIPERALEMLLKWKSEDRRRKDIYSRSAGGFTLGAAQLGVALGASVIDPINVASAFVPVVGPARYAKRLAEARSALGRTGVRARVGAVEGTVGAALVEPIVLSSAQFQQADYDLWDSILNIAVGTALGGGLHTGLGAASDAIARGGRVRPQPGLPQVLDDMSMETREIALRTSIAQAASGRNIDVEPVFDIERFSRGERSLADIDAEAQARVETSVEVQSVMSQVAELRGNQVRRPQTLSEWIRQRGGLKEFQGEVAAAVGDARGLISGRGRNIDDAALAAWEAGYFPNLKDRPTPAEFLEALDEDVRFKNRFSDEDTDTVERFKQQEELKSDLSGFGVSMRDSDAKIQSAVAKGLDLQPEGRPLSRADFDALTDARLESVTNPPVRRLQRSFDPAASRMADESAARAADEQLKTAPADDAMPDETLEEVLEDTERLAQQLDDQDLVKRELAPFDELEKTAESYGDAVRAAGECQLRRGAA